MNIVKAVVFGFSAAVLMLAFATGALAFQIGAGGAVGPIHITQVNPTGSLNTTQLVNPTPNQSPQRFRQLDIVGDVGLSESQLPGNAQIVHLRVDGHDVYMRLDTELNNADLQFDPNAHYARELYRSILAKRIEVVGQQDLREKIIFSANTSRPIQVQGYVFDITSPFLVLKSVNRGPAYY